MCAWTHNKVFWCHYNLQFLGMTILNSLVFHFKYEYISIIDERVLNRNLCSLTCLKKNYFPFFLMLPTTLIFSGSIAWKVGIEEMTFFLVTLNERPIL